MTRSRLLRLMMWAFACLPLLAGPAAAGNLPAPTGEPLLTFTGLIEHRNQGDVAVFDRAMLNSLPAVTFTTTTVWTTGAQTFTGVPLVDLLAAVGATGSALYAKAANDYAVEIPAADAVAGGPIVAYLLNGREMSLREKGPLWVIYPYDPKPEYRAEAYYVRSIWQLVSIDVRE